MSHDFHFVLNNKLKKNIADFAKSKNISLSGTVIFILNFMKPVLEKYYLKDVFCKKPEYARIKADKDMHVYFKKIDYKYLRQIQSNLYCHSMAMILRFALNEFFNGVSKYGFRIFFKVVSKFGKTHHRTKFKFNPLSKKQHMFYSIQNFNYICHIFDHEYNLIQTKFT